MHIIGVIDLKDGNAVHARGGRREQYAPIARSAGLEVNGNPLVLARMYLEAFKLSDIYVADLNAIRSTGSGSQDDIIGVISALGASLWIDAGIARAADARRVVSAGAHILVVGLETLPSFDALADICRSSPRPVIFSLDLREGAPFAGGAAAGVDSPETIAAQAVRAGAQSIVVLDLARVGAREGPDVSLLHRVRAAVPDTPVLAGGGIRDLQDLQQLAQIGCAGALVATAIHEGRLTPADIAAARAL